MREVQGISNPLDRGVPSRDSFPASSNLACASFRPSYDYLSLAYVYLAYKPPA